MACSQSDSKQTESTSDDSTARDCNGGQRQHGTQPDYAQADRYILAHRNGLRCHGRPLLPNAATGEKGVMCNRDSVNFERADGPQEAVQYIVIHTIEGWEEATEECFASPNWQAATHYVVGRSCPAPDEPDAGSLWAYPSARTSLQYPVVVTQMISEADTASHTAAQVMDRLSVGIEHEGFIKNYSYLLTDEQYLRSARLVRDIARRHSVPIDREHIIGHYQIPRCDISCPGLWDPNCACEKNLQVCSADKTNDECVQIDLNHADPGNFWPWDRYMDMVRYDANRISASCVPRADGTAQVTLELENTGVQPWGKTDVVVGISLPWDWLDATRDWDQTAAQAETIRWRAETDATTPRDHDSLLADASWVSTRRVKFAGELAVGTHATIAWNLHAPTPFTGQVVETFALVYQTGGRETWFAQDQSVTLTATVTAGSGGASVISACEIGASSQPVVPPADSGAPVLPNEGCVGKVGWYCGASAQFPYGEANKLYLCASGSVSDFRTCQSGCQVNDAGVDDICK